MSFYSSTPALFSISSFYFGEEKSTRTSAAPRGNGILLWTRMWRRPYQSLGGHTRTRLYIYIYTYIHIYIYIYIYIYVCIYMYIYISVCVCVCVWYDTINIYTNVYIWILYVCIQYIDRSNQAKIKFTFWRQPMHFLKKTLLGPAKETYFCLVAKQKTTHQTQLAYCKCAVFKYSAVSKISDATDPLLDLIWWDLVCRIFSIYMDIQYVTAEWEPAFLRQAREFLFFPGVNLLPREASKWVPIFDRGTGSKPERLRSGSLQADLSLIV